MRIRVVNPNTTVAMTDTIGRAAAAVAGPAGADAFAEAVVELAAAMLSDALRSRIHLEGRRGPRCAVPAAMPLKGFYCDHFVLPLPEGHRFPMQKYRLLREQVVERGLVEPGDLIVPEAAKPRRDVERDDALVLDDEDPRSRDLGLCCFVHAATPGLSSACRARAGGTGGSCTMQRVPPSLLIEK